MLETELLIKKSSLLRKNNPLETSLSSGLKNRLTAEAVSII
jgi:hypothetical protein